MLGEMGQPLRTIFVSQKNKSLAHTDGKGPNFVLTEQGSLPTSPAPHIVSQFLTLHNNERTVLGLVGKNRTDVLAGIVGIQMGIRLLTLQ